MDKGLIARRYATASVQHLPPEKHKEILEQLQRMKSFVKDANDFINIIGSAMISKHEKIEIVKAVFAKMDNKEFWTQIFILLIKKQRCNLIDNFLFELELKLKQAINLQKVKLVFAFEHDEKEVINLIKEEVGKILNCNVEFEVSIDRDIKAGFIASTDSRYIDASLRTNLERFAIKRKKL